MSLLESVSAAKMMKLEEHLGCVIKPEAYRTPEKEIQLSLKCSIFPVIGDWEFPLKYTQSQSHCETENRQSSRNYLCSEVRFTLLNFTLLKVYFCRTFSGYITPVVLWLTPKVQGSVVNTTLLY